MIAIYTRVRLYVQKNTDGMRKSACARSSPLDRSCVACGVLVPRSLEVEFESRQRTHVHET